MAPPASYQAEQTSGNRCTAWHEVKGRHVQALPNRHFLGQHCLSKSQDVNRPDDTAWKWGGHAKIGKLLANPTSPIGN